jgi:predicted RNase H-like nuclease (RuvC/YqgF family)
LASETEKKGISWFKGVLSSQNQVEKNSVEQQAVLTEVAVEELTSQFIEHEQQIKDSVKQTFSKENQDKIAMDVMVSIENMLKDRQLLFYKNKGFEDQLYAANETINRFKHDLIKKDHLLQEKYKEIHDLEKNLTNKQMRYDQLLEDYKEYQRHLTWSMKKFRVSLRKKQPNTTNFMKKLRMSNIKIC